MLHRNLLLPFMAPPLSKPGVDSTIKPSNSSQQSPVEVETVGDNLGSKQGSRDAVDTASTSDGGIVVDLLFYVHGKHLRSCRDGQLT